MAESPCCDAPTSGWISLRAGARELVRRAVEAEVAALLAAYDDERTESGRRRVVRHGHGPERAILTGIGPVVVRRPKVRDRGEPGRTGFGFIRRSCRGSRGIEADETETRAAA